MTYKNWIRNEGNIRGQRFNGERQRKLVCLCNNVISKFQNGTVLVVRPSGVNGRINFKAEILVLNVDNWTSLRLT